MATQRVAWSKPDKVGRSPRGQQKAAPNMTRTTLGKVIDSLDKFDDYEVIFIQPTEQITADTPAQVVWCTDDGTPPDTAQGMEPLLEVFVAKEVIEVWSKWRGGRSPSNADKIDAVLYYFEHDAYLPVDD